MTTAPKRERVSFASPEYSPMPWTLDETWMLIKGPKGEEIAAIHGGQVDGERMTRTAAINLAHANGRLIAAAPVMAYALELADKELERMGCDCGDIAEPDCPVCTVKSALRLL